jgi:hypothetical protein
MDTVMCEIVNAFYVGNNMNLMLTDNDCSYLIRFGLLLMAFVEHSG